MFSGGVNLSLVFLWLSSKESTHSVGGMHLIPRSGEGPWRRGHGIPLLYSCLGNPKERGTRRATVYRFARESDTTGVTELMCINLSPQQRKAVKQ